MIGVVEAKRRRKNVSAAIDQAERYHAGIAAGDDFSFAGGPWDAHILVPQDPSDEPASVLLERIRAEREAMHGRSGKTERAINAKRRRGRKQ